MMSELEKAIQKIKQIPSDEEIKKWLEKEGLDTEKLNPAFILGFKSGVIRQRVKFLGMLGEYEKTHELIPKGQISARLLERLADLEHRQWSHWIKFEHQPEMMISYKKDPIPRWVRLANTPYKELMEKEKEFDREWARRVLASLGLTHVVVEKKQLRELKFCDGTFECFNCIEQGEPNCDSNCQWIKRFEQLKAEFVKAKKG